MYTLTNGLLLEDHAKACFADVSGEAADVSAGVKKAYEPSLPVHPHPTPINPPAHTSPHHQPQPPHIIQPPQSSTLYILPTLPNPSTLYFVASHTPVSKSHLAQAVSGELDSSNSTDSGNGQQVESMYTGGLYGFSRRCDAPHRRYTYIYIIFVLYI